jgi:hypothetical protein
MLKFKKIQQKARIVLNSQDAVKTKEWTRMPVKNEKIYFDPSISNVIDITNNIILYNDHNFSTGDAVTYTVEPGDIAIAPLTINTVYYIINHSVNSIKLASSYANALAGTPIDLTSVGSGIHTFTNTLTFDGSNNAIVDITNNTIIVPNHSLYQGEYIQYTTNGTPITGLVNNRSYYAIVVDNNTIKLCNSFQEATSANPPAIDLTGLGVGNTHYLKTKISFASSGSPVLNVVNDSINIPSHNYKTGDAVWYEVHPDGTVVGSAIGGLIDNQFYIVVVIDTDTIQLAGNLTDALAIPPNVINLSIPNSSTIGSKHSLMKAQDWVEVCSNYKFKLQNAPVNLSEKCRLAVQSFHYLKNYDTKPIQGIGGVYIKSLPPIDLYTTQGYYKGQLLSNANFADTFEYQNADFEYNSIPLPDNMTQLLQNGIDIFVDTKKLNFSNEDVKGFVDEDAFNLSLIIYEIDDFEYITDEMNTNVKNRPNVRFIK